MKNRPALSLGLPLAAALFALLAGCGHGSLGARVDNGVGTVNVYLTDAPLDLAGVKSVNVTLTGVVLFPADEQVSMPVQGVAGDEDGVTPVVILSHPATFDLLTLTGGATALLGTDEVPAGTYSRVRLEVSEAGLVYQDGTTASLKIESGKDRKSVV